MDFKKIKRRIYTVIQVGAAGLAASGLATAYAETVDLSIITDVLPMLITLMVVSAVMGMIKGFKV